MECKKGRVNRPRGLCWHCYYTPGVKEKHPPTSKYARRGLGNLSTDKGDPEPTVAPPGSLEKLIALHERAKLGLALHAEGDKANYEDPSDHCKARSDAYAGPENDGTDKEVVRRRRKRSKGPRFAGVGAYSARVARQNKLGPNS